MKKLTKADIFAADDLPTEDIDIPEWGGVVTVRTLTGVERDEWELAAYKATRNKQTDTRGLKARLVQLTVVNGNGGLMFTVPEVPKLNKKSAAAIDRIFEVAQRLNHFTTEDVEELAGNSDAGPAGGSTSS